MPQSAAPSAASVPWLYSLFFLWIEPFSTLVGAYFSFLQQDEYMRMTLSSAAVPILGVTATESIVLNQLANLYFVFAFNEALVLRATADRKVWKAFLLGLLIADFGHLYSVHLAGWPVYYRFWEWNAMYWGNLGFVYVGAAMRTAYLLDIGFNTNTSIKVKK